jgi:tRNA-binding protein
MEPIQWRDFDKVDLRAGTVLAAEDFPQARSPAYLLRIDFGPELGVKTSSARITDLYATEDLTGKKVMAVVNLPQKQIGPVLSECLVTGFHREDGAVTLAVPDGDVPDGTRLA